jgi:hypothetical protein
LDTLTTKVSAEALLSSLGGLMGVVSVVAPWYSITVQAFGLGSANHSLIDEYFYWASLPVTDPQTAMLADANTKVWIAAGVLMLMVVGGILGFLGFRLRVARMLGAVSIASGLVVFEYVLRPFGTVSSGFVAVTAPSWGFYIAIVAALFLLVAFFHRTISHV